MSKPLFPDIDELLQRLLDGQLQPEEMERLQQAMRDDPRVWEYYVDSMLVCAVLRRSSQADGELSQSILRQALPGGGSRDGFRRIRFGRHFYRIATALILGTVILGSVIVLWYWARGPAIGRLTGAVETQWRGADPRIGDSLFMGSYDLREGVARMELEQGTSLLLEAPCRLDLTSVDEAVLKSGRLALVVPLHAAGYRVRTRTALITDLGTEFGVIARPDGSTEAHVLKGHISVTLDPNIAGRPTSLIAEEGQATTVDATGRTIQGGLDSREDLFLLELPPSSQPSSPSERLNLADIVGGGDGRGTGSLDQGIDLGTGQVFRHLAKTIQRAPRSEFRPTPQYNGIDGVFVPNRDLGPVVVSSTGLLFAECPETLGTYFGGPANSSGKFFDLLSQQTYRVRLHGISFGTSKHPALSLHPNAGITFDLDPIRQDNPSLQIDRFTAICGIPKDVPYARFGPADVWVLLDGAVRLHIRFPTEPYAVEKVDVSIPARTRFLTLAATCPERADFSWIIFGDPFLRPAALAR